MFLFLPLKSRIVFRCPLFSFFSGFFEVMATSGDTHLGGQDFDQRVIEYVLKQFKKKTGLDASKDKRAISKVLQCSRTRPNPFSSARKLSVPSVPSPAPTRLALRSRLSLTELTSPSPSLVPSSKTSTWIFSARFATSLSLELCLPVSQHLPLRLSVPSRRFSKTPVSRSTKSRRSDSTPSFLPNCSDRSRWWLHSYPQDPTTHQGLLQRQGAQ